MRSFWPLALSVLFTACAVEPGVDDAVDVPDAVLEHPPRAFLDRSLRLSQYDDAQLTIMADSPIVILPLRLLVAPESVDPIARIRELNPDVVIFGVLPTLSVNDVWNVENQRGRMPLTTELYDLLSTRTARTVDDEIPLMWRDAPMINPMLDGELDEALLQTVVDLVVDAIEDYPTHVDGIFHDYLSEYPFVWPDGEAEVDLDGDGLGAREDDDDRDVWIAWQRELPRRIQARLGSGFIQIANGRLPHTHADVAQYVAGIVYEAFPRMVWAYSDREGMELVLEHLEPGHLTPRRGRTWSLLWDRSGQRPDFCRLASALTGQPYALTDLQGFAGVDEDLVRLGVPTGELEMVETGDGGIEYRRAFGTLEARLRLDANGATTDAGIVTR